MKSTVLFLVVALFVIEESTSSTIAPHVCPMFRCAEPCTTRFGKDNCPKGCDCPKTCADAVCPDGQKCAVQPLDCAKPPCATVLICKQCPARIMCPMIAYKCAEGCSTYINDNCCVGGCSCPNKKCHDIQCAKGEKCVLRNVQCTTAPCYPVPTCTTVCPGVTCDLACLNGRETDSNGCETCGCLPEPSPTK